MKKKIAAIQQEINNYLKYFLTKELKNKNLSIQDAVINFILSSGKRIRPIIAYNTYISNGGKNKKEALKICCALEILHSYLLIHDDVIDNDEIRRGEMTVWKYYYEKRYRDIETARNIAILSGNLLHALINKLIVESKFSHKIKCQIINQMSITNHIVNMGQIRDLELQYQNNFSKKEIMKMYQEKTSSYTIETPIMLGAILAQSNKKTTDLLLKYAKLIGIAYQIQDDILGSFGEQEISGKSTQNDIIKKKKTLLLAETMDLANRNQQRILQAIYKKNKLNQQDVKNIKNIMIQSGALKKTQTKLARMVKTAKNIINNSNYTHDQKEFFIWLADYSLSRKK